MSELRPLLALERLNARRLVGPLAVIIVGTLLFTGGVVWGSLGGIGRLGLRAGLAIMYAPPLLVILGALGLFAGDRMPLLGTLPARRRTIVTARFISLGVLTGLALVMALVQSLWSDMGVQSGISPVLAGLFVVCLVAPLAYRRGADQGQWSTALLVVAGVAWESSSSREWSRHSSCRRGRSQASCPPFSSSESWRSPTSSPGCTPT